MRLGPATSPAVGSVPDATLLVPVGSCEQHGPHLPLDTDTRIAVAVAERAAERLDACWVAPAVAYGSSGEHQSFPGTVSIGTEALTTLLVELARSAQPGSGPTRFAHVVFVNGHGGNTEAVTAAVARLRREGRSVTTWSPRWSDGDAHAGRTETSLLLAIDPAVVGPERPVGNTRPLGQLLEPMRAGGVAAVSANGVLGDATGASATAGMAVLEGLVADLVAHVQPVDDPIEPS